MIDLDARGDHGRKIPKSSPSLEDSPLQKEFIANLATFESQLVIVIVLSLVVVATGILGTFLCKSVQLQYISYLALGLNLNWFAGFMLVGKVKRELQNVKFTNLNGQAGFETLMLFCQMQILIMAFIYLFSLALVRDVFVELKEMALLAAKPDGSLWTNEYGDMPHTTVHAILVSFTVI